MRRRRWRTAARYSRCSMPRPASSITIRVREAPSHLALDITSASPAGKVEAVVWGPYPTGDRQDRRRGDRCGARRPGRARPAGPQHEDPRRRPAEQRGQHVGARHRGDGASVGEHAAGLRHQPRPRAPGGRAGVASTRTCRCRRLPARRSWGAASRCSPAPSRQRSTCSSGSSSPSSLPHPTIDGVWFRKSPLFEKSYLISSFGEADVDEMIGYTKRAGLISLYHEGPFQELGTFRACGRTSSPTAGRDEAWRWTRRTPPGCTWACTR